MLPLASVEREIISTNMTAASRKSMDVLIKTLTVEDGNNKGLQASVPMQSSAIVVFPSLADYGPSLAFLIVFNNGNDLDATIFRDFSVLLCELLRPLLLLTFSTLASLFSDFSWNKMNRTLQVYKHEVGHNISVLDGMHYDLKNMPMYQASSKDKTTYKECIDHMYGVLMVMGQLNETTKILNSIPERRALAPLTIDYTFLSYWAEVFRWQNQGHCLGLKILEGMENNSRSIQTDAVYLQHIIYNLLSNAFKYVFDGTNIYVDCKSTALDTTLSVTDYGVYITNDQKKPYELFYRSQELILSENGSGIGLHVAQKIAQECLDVTIRHTPELVSDFYVPYMQPYLDLPEDQRDPVISERVISELQRLKDTDEYGRIVSIYQDERKPNFSDTSVRRCIEKIGKTHEEQYKTYKVCFYITF